MSFLEIIMKQFLALGLLSLSIALAPSESMAAWPGSVYRKLLGPYPAHGSVEEAQDLETLLQYQENRSEEECRLASLESKASLATFFGNHHNLLTQKELKGLKITLFIPLVRAGINIGLAKRTFKRPRPYLHWQELTPCIAREKSTAYPSGHATLSRVYARLLSKIYPERAEAFMKRAEEAARFRVLGGVHHPSDIAAGKKLGDRVASRIIGSKEFVGMLKDLKAQ